MGIKSGGTAERKNRDVEGGYQWFWSVCNSYQSHQKIKAILQHKNSTIGAYCRCAKKKRDSFVELSENLSSKKDRKNPSLF